MHIIASLPPLLSMTKMTKRYHHRFATWSLLLLLCCFCSVPRIAFSNDDHAETDGANPGRESLSSSSSTSETATSTQESQECVVDIDGQCQNIDATATEGTPQGETETSGVITETEDGATDATKNDDEDVNGLHEVWTKGRATEIGEYLECGWNDEEDDGESSLTEMHTEETWKLFNTVYHQAVDSERSSLPPEFQGSGFQVPIEVKYMASVGRGVFAKENIKKGTLMWTSVNTAEFTRAQDYRDFLRKLPKNLACDVLIWAYVRMISKKQKRAFKVCADLDEGSFVNHSSKPFAVNSELGVGRLLTPEDDEQLTWYGCDLEFYANRDIDAGEEIRVDYDDFVERHGWKRMGL